MNLDRNLKLRLKAARADHGHNRVKNKTTDTIGLKANLSLVDVLIVNKT